MIQVAQVEKNAQIQHNIMVVPAIRSSSNATRIGDKTPQKNTAE